MTGTREWEYIKYPKPLVSLKNFSRIKTLTTHNSYSHLKHFTPYNKYQCGTGTIVINKIQYLSNKITMQLKFSLQSTTAVLELNDLLQQYIKYHHVCQNIFNI